MLNIILCIYALKIIYLRHYTIYIYYGFTDYMIVLQLLIPNMVFHRFPDQ